MANQAYLKLLHDPRWQKLRLKALEAADWKCAKCADSQKTLHVHHPFYDVEKMPWEYDVSELRVLCDDCHAKEHGILLSPLLTIAEQCRQDVRDAEAKVAARAMEMQRQRSGEAPRTPIEAEIEAVQTQIPLAEKFGDRTWLNQLMARAIDLNRRRLGMVA